MLGCASIVLPIRTYAFVIGQMLAEAEKSGDDMEAQSLQMRHGDYFGSFEVDNSLYYLYEIIKARQEAKQVSRAIMKRQEPNESPLQTNGVYLDYVRAGIISDNNVSASNYCSDNAISKLIGPSTALVRLYLRQIIS